MSLSPHEIDHLSTASAGFPASLATTDLAIVPPDVNHSGFSIIIPVFNEERAIAQTIDQIHATLAQTLIPYELIAVDDGSTDRTAVILKERSDITLFQHSLNRGYGAALKTGLRHAKYPLVVITDADGTYPNERIPELVALCSDCEMVVGARIGQDVSIPLIRRFPKYFLRRFAEWMARERIPDMNSGLRIFKKEVAERFFGILPDGFSFTTTITLAMLTNRYRVKFEPINYHARIGKSKIKPIRDTLRFIQLIFRTGMYFAPLRVFLPIAFTFLFAFLVSLGYDIFVLKDLTEKTLILLLTATQTGLFAMLADMVDKRAG